MIFIGTNAQSQIRQKIMGVTIGVTPKRTVFRTITDQGYTVSEKPNALIVHTTEYAGYHWQKITFFYYKNVLYKVEFYNPCVLEEVKELYPKPTSHSVIFSTLKNILSNKYGRYKNGDFFVDGKTRIRFEESKMIYENIELASKADNSAIDDL